MTNTQSILFIMQFGVSILLLMPFFGAALGEDLPTLSIADENGFQVSGRGDMRAQACPPDFPRYCPVGGFCCRTLKCCPLSCCLDSARYCINGHCYA